jgi:hypothetical protein
MNEARRANALIELIYSGHMLAARLVHEDEFDSGLFVCVCGPVPYPYKDPANHQEGCPIMRFYIAVDAAQLAFPSVSRVDDSEEHFFNLKSGLIVAGLIDMVFLLALYGHRLIAYFAQKAGLPW